MKHDIRQIAELLASRAEDVCRWLLPAGTNRSGEWCVGNVGGAHGDSLRVNLRGKAGVWRDFAADEKGGDLIDLIMAVKGVPKAEAVMQAKEYLGLYDDGQSFTPKRKAYSKPEKPRCKKPDAGLVSGFFQARGLNSETVSAFSIGQQNGKSGDVIVFPYLRDGNLVHIKYRVVKEKTFWTSKDTEPCLFGWQAIPENCREIAITEGELDAMSMYQAGVSALSVPYGGGDAGKQDGWIDADWERLQLFDTIILALDNDEKGKSATRHILSRLGAHRCKVVDFGAYKDANEALRAGADLRKLCDAAKYVAPEELHSAVDYITDVIDFFWGENQQKGALLPWGKGNAQIALRPAETSIWAGTNSHGKSQVLGHVAVDTIAQGARWCVASMEFKPHILLSRMVRQCSGEPRPKSDKIFYLINEYFAGNLFIFDVQGTAKASRILEVFDYACRRYGVTHFLVDSLAKCGIGEDSYNDQKAFVDQLSDFARQRNVHVHLVCHTRKGKDESEMPDKFDIKGTGSISDMADNVFVVWRNKKKELKIQEARTDHERQVARRSGSDAAVMCCKQRNGTGWEGRIKLWFDLASLQYLEAANGAVTRYYVCDSL